MFLCKHCGEQYEDNDLAYTLILENRANLTTADLFLMKFCSKAHLQEFLHHISAQQQRYLLTKIEKGSSRQFEADYPLNLLLLVGSSKAS